MLLQGLVFNVRPYVVNPSHYGRLLDDRFQRKVGERRYRTKHSRGTTENYEVRLTYLTQGPRQKPKLGQRTLTGQKFFELGTQGK